MSTVLNIFAAAVNGIVAIPAAVVSLEILAALPKRQRRDTAIVIARPPVAVLVPAHNEHDTIVATVTRLVKQLREDDRLLVVADNCTDDTAVLARAAGAEVLERHNLVERGKGFALDAGRQFLSSDPRPVLVIVDADVRLADGTLDRLAATAAGTQRPVQGVYLLRQAANVEHQNPISMLAFQVRNYVRPFGLHRLGGPCPLFGAGMAFPWAIIKDAPLASPHLTEDVALALDLACVGHPPILCPDALIEGDSAPTSAASEKQRKRWEHGHLSLITSAAPKTLLTGLLRGKLSAVALALDVMVPPLSLLVMSVTMAAVLTNALALTGLISFGVAMIPTIAMLSVLTMVITASIRFGEKGQRMRQLIAMAKYATGKMPIYTTFLFKRQKTWERTDRAPQPPAPTPRNPRNPKKAA